ncbi:MAG: hypothetical protein LKH74_05130 [Levilactobacillus sp.]|uniref:Uncharacterized protein n=1 Tax=Levilactobacillus suantsaiihabitans TaxID=2487722 RepID=A0A4Z0J7Z7_9LACO|nr:MULTISPECIES: hypothetical protein [Levilactobacillus]MCH4124339.1 hypothetical protein [Levilactobacillus sp.]MCI1553289.1 hypothetical protein [Levilactobacillus sp.]MCI1598544.1 hypothetical protein [Levilactobacillus sp.]MCI1605206.1 hypothetical protein [Levilactobacillus sp.]TGD17746.1 hypothetical protein EGT51_11125 [Levilactobacillus suantsaiihabitans]
MKPVRQGPKHWLALLTAGILLFAGGGGTGYMLGQQQAKSAQPTQLKNAPKGKRPAGAPSGMPSQSSSSN